MAKSDSGDNTVKSISKSQKNLSKRLAAQAKRAPITRGGKCSCCGLTASTCTTGTVHTGCNGFPPNREDLFPEALTILVSRGINLNADGSKQSRGNVPTWLPVSTFDERLAHAEECAKGVLRKEVHVHPIVELKDAVFQNGLGEYLSWSEEHSFWVLSDIQPEQVIVGDEVLPQVA